MLKTYRKSLLQVRRFAFKEDGKKNSEFNFDHFIEKINCDKNNGLHVILKSKNINSVSMSVNNIKTRPYAIINIKYMLDDGRETTMQYSGTEPDEVINKALHDHRLSNE